MFVKEDKGVVRFKIDDFVKLTTKRECKSIEIGNIDWILGAQSETSTRTNDVKHLGVFLTCQNTSRSNLWSCNASIRFSLVKLNSNDKNDAFSMDFEQKFDVNAKILEVPNFKSWEEAICPKNGFIFDPFAVVEAHITIKNVVGIHEKVLKTFEKPDEHLTDVVLIVEGMKVHVGKQILATSSKFFHALFYSKFSESSQQEIKLVDVKHLEFVDFLNLIYPTHKCIDEDNVEHLLKLADRLEAPSVLEKCEEYLISSNEVHKVMKLKYAEIYKLSRLQDKCLNTITSRQDIVTLSKHEDYKSLGDCTYNVLLQKMIELNC